ncbi:hypothetical protein [Streptomyces lavendulocolor]|uniref:hypothetical protein n=1 Tax=Streptomyces lavendulocolor TaxID=67316 RepID=UPI0033EDF151
MTDHHTYGTSTYTVGELVRLVSDHLGLVFIEHDSFYRGIYHLADCRRGRIGIQPNPIPGDDGDDGEDDLYAAEPPTLPSAVAHDHAGGEPRPAYPLGLHRRAHPSEPRGHVNRSVGGWWRTASPRTLRLPGPPAPPSRTEQ